MRVRGTVEELIARQPADIALAPVRNQTDAAKVPVSELREAFSTALVERLYSPLDLAYTDGNWVESSFRGTPAPDALLVVAITEWDTSRLFSNGRITAAGEVLMFAGGSTTGTPLWGATVRRQLDLSDGRGSPPAPSVDLAPRACELFARQALTSLPERDPVAAHTP